MRVSVPGKIQNYGGSVSVLGKKFSARWCRVSFERLDVCRFHGARGGAPKGKRNGVYRHARKGKQSPRADKDRKFIIEPHFAGRKSLM